ncbi:DUF4350 domain-containing protein [Cellulomonas sp. PhB150]|uniref:DUF4350 domain-containing protein n=1 Tax=Cellulomonas sp. PhB150 TaxID=2485188 RepID=UPI000F4A9A29|nr:DUF4350 domain-containing protein [Cellulomonas sp. PhB150]ROS31186.1 hypothetical protein EDF34_0841 [Cellulomonas sp. PhB150]
MTTTAPAPVVGDGTTARSRATGRWRRWRGPIAILSLLCVVGLLAALPEPRTSSVPLAPDSTAATGARAVAQILEEQGVQVTFVRRASAARAAATPGSTVLLAGDRNIFDQSQFDFLADLDADLVLVDASWPASELAGVDSSWSDVATSAALEPGCDDPDATAAGSLRASGRVLASSPDTVVCFRGPGDAADQGAYTVRTVEGQRVAVLADAAPLMNAHLAEAGNAALVLRMLGRHDHLVWYLPSPYDTGSDEGEAGPGLGDLVPPVVGVLGLQLLLVVVVVAFWRGRRLGRLVTEPMPVVVPAAEATRGRGRLYRRSRSYGHAAAALRAGAASRCARRLGLPGSTPAPQLIDAVALATGRRNPDVAALFYGPPPTDDSALARLARDLDDIESEVQSS